MPEFLVTLLEREDAPGSIADVAHRVTARAAYVERLRASGAYLDGAQFRPSSEGRRVRDEGGRVVVERGPFGGDVLAGYHFVQAPSLDAATELAKGLPRGPSESVDVRPPMKAHVRARKDEVPGKVLAFAVLGAAPDEQAWTRTMDRIDAETHDGFPEGAFLGGMRLQAPRTGRRLAAAADGGLVLDGPFMEAKEMIGGLFFLRAASVDEAVAWAKASAFVRHGALEIRELRRA